MHARSFVRRFLQVLLAIAFGSSGLLPALPSPAVAAPLASSRTALSGTRRPKEVVAKWAPGVQSAQVSAAAERIGFRVVREQRKLGWSLVAPTKPGLTPQALLDSLRRGGLVQKAQLERFYTAQQGPTPDDPLYASQWALHNTGQTGGTAGADTSAHEAWSRTTGSKDVVVAVVDTGIDWQHADLRANIWTNAKEIPGNGIDDDGDGYVDDVHGYDFGNRDATLYDPEDGDQHGTHVAGIIGAAGNNATGISGVNWDVTILPVKFLVQGDGTDFDGAEAIRYAVDRGADVINCSWGGTEQSDILDEAIGYAAQHGVLCVTAAGNDSQNVDEMPFYPGCIDSTAIVNVAATDANDEIAEFSNYGKAVDLAAPGVDITSTLPYECAGLYVDKFPYRVMYLAFPAEDVGPAATRDEILARSVSKLSPMTDGVLVVDDSSPGVMGEVAGERLGTYVDALHDAGYSDVTTWSVDERGTPAAPDMTGRTVVWFTGAVPSLPWLGPILSDAERHALASFLDSGGRLLLSGGEVADDLLWWDPAWLEDYLHAGFTDFETWGFGLKGFAGTCFEGLSGEVPQRGDATSSDSIFALDKFATPVVGLGGYGPLSGTSMAAPHVAGAAALLMAEFHDANSAEVRDRLLGTVDRRAGLTAATAFGGRLNAWAAMQDYAGRPKIVGPASGDVLRGGHEQRLAWTTPESSSLSATFEAQLALPAIALETGFEDGTLGTFATSPGVESWTVTDTAHTGSYAIRSGTGSQDYSSAWTTVTVQDGGGSLSFWYRFDGNPIYAGAFMSVDDTFYPGWFSGAAPGWQKVSVKLPAGEHRLIWTFTDDEDTPRSSVCVDDICATGFDYQPLATAPAGAAELTFTVPATDTPHARLRMRSVLGGNHSVWSDPADVRLSTDDSPPSAPGAFTATPGGDGDVALSWTNPSAGEGAVVRVLRRLDAVPAGPDDPGATIVYEGTALTVRDAGMKAGDTARYAAYAIDPAENVSDPALATAAVSDNTPPAAIQGLRAGLSEGVVGICWIAPPASECTRVRLLRRTDTTPTGPSDPGAVVVYDGPGSFARDYLLTRHPFSGTARYAIFPFDSSGNAGPRSAVSLAVDTNGLKGSFALNGGAPFSTSPTVTAGSGVPGAVRMRFNAGESFGAWQPYAASATLRLDPPLDGLHVVKAEYEDAGGQRVTLTASIFLEIAPPAAPAEVKAQGWNERVKLTWKQSPEADVAGYKVYASTRAAGPYEEIGSCEPSSVVGFVVGAPVGYGYFKVSAYDVAGLESAPSAAVPGASGDPITRVSGKDRYQTAVEVSKRHFASADTVVLATGENFADALSASGLAGSYGCPILLTRRDSLPPAVASELARLGAHKVFIIGGPSTISEAVASSLAGTYTVKRLSGPDRYATSVAVARELDAHETTPPASVMLVNGGTFADGVSVAAAAYASHTPVLLTRAASMPATVAAMIDWLGVETVYVIGGPGSVSWDIEDSLQPMAQRLGGENRYDTSAMIAETFVGEGVVNLGYVALASGTSYPDALTGAAAAGKEGGAVILTAPDFPRDETYGLFEMRSLEIGRVEILGGTKSVSDDVKDALQELLDMGGPLVPESAFEGGGASEPLFPPDEPLVRR